MTTAFDRAEANWETNTLNRHLASVDEYDYFIMWCEENDLDPEETDIEQYREYVEEQKAEWMIEQRELDQLYREDDYGY